MTARPFVVAAVALASLVVGGCLPSMPHRVPGSDITLPDTPEQTLLGALTSLCVGADTAVAPPPGRARCARTPAESGRTSPDPAPPPGQKTP